MTVNHRLIKQVMMVLLFASLAFWGYSTPIVGVTAASAEEVARPSNPGGPGAAVNLTGHAMRGKKVYGANCMGCHGKAGRGGVLNPGSSDGTVPPLNPIDSTMVSKNYKTFAKNIDLFIQHGSTPDGPHPAMSMPAWGDSQRLSQHQIADVIAYIIRLNRK